MLVLLSLAAFRTTLTSLIAEVDHRGLIFSPLSEKVDAKHIEVLWWLPLCSRPDEGGFSSAVENHRDTDYDYQQAAMLVLECFEPVDAWAGQQLHESLGRILLDVIFPQLREAIINNVSPNRRQLLESVLPESFLRSALQRAIDEHLDLTSLADSLVDLIGNQEDPTRLFCSECC